MKSMKVKILCMVFVACGLFAFLAVGVAALDKKEYKVFIVSDTLKDKFVELQNGFRDSLDKQLAAVGAKANYTVFDTKTDKTTVPGIIQSIKDGQPDLTCVINSSGVFADTNITNKLTDPKFRFVSENCIPVQSGIAKTWAKPGGNVTGVGVFVQYTSVIKLAQMINPKAKKIIFYSWDAVKPLNAFLEAELRAAGKATNAELAEFKLFSSTEDEFEYLAAADDSGPEYFVIPGVDVWVHRDGSAGTLADAINFYTGKNRHMPFYTYDEAGVRVGNLAGTCVVWADLGAQLADKGMKILQGANPGDLGWDYPRKYNLMFNLAAAKQIGVTIPDNLRSAAYRLYTDYDGHFVGQK